MTSFENAAELKRHFQLHLIPQQPPRVWTSQYQPRNDATIQCLESDAAQRHHTTKVRDNERRIQEAPPYVASSRTFSKRQLKPQSPLPTAHGIPGCTQVTAMHVLQTQSITKHTRMRGIHVSRKRDKNVLRTEG